MEKITAEKERNVEDEEASKVMLEVKTEAEPEKEPEKEPEPEHYSKLRSTSEDVYSEAYYAASPFKTRPAGSQNQGNVRLYRAACIFLGIICLVLLLVIGILCLKLQTGSTVCAETQETTAINRPTIPSFDQTCSFEECQAHFQMIQPNSKLGCQQCANGWLRLGQSCFYLSRFRLSWDESQRNCTARGGSLAVIDSLRLQNFLTKEGKMKYWIGLRRQGATWTWVNNAALRQSYWGDNMPEEACGILSSEGPPEKNWMRASCEFYTYFICQVQLQ